MSLETQSTSCIGKSFSLRACSRLGFAMIPRVELSPSLAATPPERQPWGAAVQETPGQAMVAEFGPTTPVWTK